jgi:hypothetical protein
MKKYTILFALLTGVILLAFEAVPALQVSAQSICGAKGQPPCPSNPGSGGPQIPGPKNKKPTPVPPTPVPPTAVPAGPVLSGPQLPPVVIGLPTSYPTPYPIHLPDQNLCRIGPCWPFIINPGDPVELLAGGGFLAFLIVIGVAFFRSRSASGGGGGPG